MTITKIHKLIFKFFNLIGIFSLKFDGKKFKIPKIRYFLSSILIFGYLALRLFIHLKSFYERKSKAKTTSFSIVFFEAITHFYILTIIMWITILLIRQKKLSEIFNDFKNFEILQINIGEVEKKIVISFGYYNLMLIAFTANYISSIMIDLDLKSLYKMLIYVVLDFPLVFYSAECLCFFNIVLIHYEFLVKNFNQLLKSQVDLVHSDCRKLVENLSKIQKLFNLLNLSFGGVFSIITINNFVGITSIVSNNYKSIKTYIFLKLSF